MLTASAEGLTTGLAGAVKGIEAFAGRIQGTLNGIAGAITGALQSIPIVGGAFAALPASGAGFIAFLHSGMKDVAALTMQAERLGISTESLAAIQLAAGPAFEGLAEHMGHLAHKLGEVVIGSQE